MDDTFLDQSIEGVLESGVTIELARWSSDQSEYDASGWADAFGDRVGSGTARLPDQSWVDLSKFCLVRPLTRTP